MSVRILGRAPLQLGKPVGAIVGPYQIASVEYEPISVLTNKTPQEAVRGFGQAPTNYAMETGIDKIARYLGIDRIALRKKNLIRKDQFPYPDSKRHALRFGRLRDRAGQGLERSPLGRNCSRSATRCVRADCCLALACRPALNRRAAIRPLSRSSTSRTRPPPGWTRA